MSSINPLHALHMWVSSQPPNVQTDISILAFANMPGASLGMFDLLDEDLNGKFLQWLEASETASPMKIVGTIISIRSAIAFFVMRNRDSKEKWKEIVTLNKTIRDDINAQGGSADFMADMIDRIPFREKTWLRTAQSWNELCSGPLSDEYLDYWILASRTAI